MLDYSRKAVFPASVVVSLLVALFAPLTFVQAAIVLGLGIAAPAMVLALWKPPTTHRRRGVAYRQQRHEGCVVNDRRPRPR